MLPYYPVNPDNYNNTHNIKHIVTRLEESLNDKIEEIGVLEMKIHKLEKDNKKMARKLKMNEEDIEYLVKVNHPLEKAYRSLQRKYQKAEDELEMMKKEAT